MATTIIGSHLVGSLNTQNATESFELASQHIGDSLKRVPDGEFGERFHWILFQGRHLDNVKGISRLGDEPFYLAGFDIRPFGFDGSVPVEEIRIENLGYADAALASYAEFKKFKEAGKFDAGTRFQVSLPTPIAVVTTFFNAGQRKDFERIYQTGLENEIARIVAGIPNDELAIQFDLAVEFAFIEQVPIPGYDAENCWYGDPISSPAKRLANIVSQIPEAVSVGAHFCYGDVAEKHFVEPKDAQNLTEFVNAVSSYIPRLDWVHIPVPIERDDDAYFAPLHALSLPERTELYLGLVHREDGVEGLERRSEAAGKVVKQFGISTECGFGRSPLEDREKIFTLHKVA